MSGRVEEKDCSIAENEELTASVLTHGYEICELCDNPTPFARCGVALEDVCVICHNAYINEYHEGENNE